MKDIWLLTVGFIAASTTGSSAMEVKGITTVTLTDGSVEAVSGAKKVTFKMITLDDHWEEQKLLETPATPMELCSDSSGTQQVGPTQLDEVPKTPLDAVVSTATPQEPHSQLAGWRRTVHSAARECMQEIQERVAVAISLKIIRFTRSWWIFTAVRSHFRQESRARDLASCAHVLVFV